MNFDDQTKSNIISSLDIIGDFLNTKYNNNQIKENIMKTFYIILENCNIHSDNTSKEDMEALNIILSFSKLQTLQEKEKQFQNLINLCCS